MTIINLTPHALVIQRGTRMPDACEKLFTIDPTTGYTGTSTEFWINLQLAKDLK